MNRKKYFDKKNSGMTLVELLVAMAIFAAAVIPMLYAFVYSTGFNFRSQQTMQATGIAQAIIEQCKGLNTGATDMAGDDLTDAATLQAKLAENTGFSIGSASYVSDAMGNYILLEDVIATNITGDAVDAGSTTRRHYDVRVYFEQIDGAISDLSTIQSMSSNTANFAGSLPGILRAQDEVAVNELISEIKTNVVDAATEVHIVGGGTTSATVKTQFNESDIKPDKLEIDRLIVIDVNDDDVRISVDYFFLGYDGSSSFRIYHNNAALPGGGTANVYVQGSMSTTTSFYRAELGAPGDAGVNADDSFSFYMDSDPSDPPVSAVYFYYFPAYFGVNTFPGMDTKADFYDHIEINNNLTDVPVNADGEALDKLDVYIFKQYNDDLDDLVLDSVDDDYEPEIIYGNANFDSYLYHNFMRNVTDDELYCSAFVSHLTSYEPPTGSFWHNMTTEALRIEAGSEMPYLDQLRDVDAPNPSVDNTRFYMESALLADEAAIPYYSRDRLTAPASEIVMYNTRYRVKVVVYPRGGSSPIVTEGMSGDFLNW
ncbi:MAG: type II secretion system GspH family protein [Lachnospiraceae bacterium]|nr:type II secretion system GspH family protein [Lachnospiraceae bacterium]